VSQNNEEREAFLWIGRAEANKQPLAYLELARVLPEAHFWMIPFPTDTAESEELSAEITRTANSLANVVLLPPRPRPQLLELMQRAVAVVSTSGFEGMPNIFLEAWANGTPALALNHDPDGIITRHQLGGYAHGQLDQLIELADHHWHNRHTLNQRATHYQTYVQTHHSPTTIGAAWAHTLQLRTPCASGTAQAATT
jgi:glycosyltransferase involved in cell wall biosynthesis